MDLKNLFGYEGKTVMSGQIIYFDYGMSSVWETDALDAASN